jgi:protein-tyrosine phosphatase
MIRTFARFVRNAPDRARHAARREAARTALAGRDGAKILFVCHGNICRSPYAEHALTRELVGVDRERWRLDSAGFIKPDRPSPPEARAVASRRGVDLESHRSRLLDRENVAASDLIYVMSETQRRNLLSGFDVGPERVWVLGDLDPEPIEKRTIRDPVEQPEPVFEKVYDRIDRCISVIAAEIGRSDT